MFEHISEPSITVNGVQLTMAQAMTLRVAVASWLMELSSAHEMELLGDIGPLYQARLVEIQKLMLKKEGR